MPNRALPPVLVLASDGQPTDDYSAGLQELLNSSWGSKSIRMAIAIGRDADVDVLQQFIDNLDFPPVSASNPEALIERIRWASTAGLKVASSPMPSQTRPIPSPPPPVDTGVTPVW